MNKENYAIFKKIQKGFNKNFEIWKETEDYLEFIETELFSKYSLEEAIFRFYNPDYNYVCEHPECNNEKRFISLNREYNPYCSRICSMEATSLKKYGTKYKSQTEEFRSKVKDTVTEKYGVENVFQLDTVKSKSKATNLMQFGVENPMHHNGIKEKVRETIISRYGGFHLGSETFKNGMLIKYGVLNPSQNSLLQEKKKLTWVSKYGVDNPMKDSYVREKARQTLIEKYGTYNPALFGKENWLRSKSSFDPATFTFSESLLNLIESHNLEIGYQSLSAFLKWNGFEIEKSSFETMIETFLKENNINYKKNDRTVLNGLEIDFLIEDKKVAIEFNGLYWHSELQGKDKKYHLNKTQLAEKKGYQLIHIFENEMVRSPEIVFSILSNKLGITKNKVYARKCEIREISSSAKNKFLIHNHIQGEDKSSVKLGLFFENELVSIMTFAKARYNKNYQWELVRFANKRDLTVLGGASKLFRYFIKTYNPESIISYADRRYSSVFSKFYVTLGFKQIGISVPNFFVLEEKYTKLSSRLNWQKHKLSEKLDNFNPALSAWDNLKNHSYDRIWDSGNFVFGWSSE